MSDWKETAKKMQSRLRAVLLMASMPLFAYIVTNAGEVLEDVLPVWLFMWDGTWLIFSGVTLFVMVYSAAKLPRILFIGLPDPADGDYY